MPAMRRRGPDPVGLLGLARRAGAAVSGTDLVRSAVRDGRARLVILAADAAEGQLGKIRGVLRHHPVPVRWMPDRGQLGAAVGSGPTTAVAVVVSTFAETLAQALPDEREDAGAGQEEADRDAGR